MQDAKDALADAQKSLADAQKALADKKKADADAAKDAEQTKQDNIKNAEYDIQSLNYDIQSAQDNIQKLKDQENYDNIVRAPSDGIILTINISKGAYTSQNQPLFTMAQGSAGYELTFKVDTASADLLSEGDQIMITLD